MSHPEITAIIRKRDVAYECLFVEYRPKKAIKAMLGVFIGLDPKDKKKAPNLKIGDKEVSFKEKLRVELDFITNLESESRGEAKRHVYDFYYEYCDWYEILVNILWDGQYLYTKRYGGPPTKRDTTFNKVKPWNE
jgi:hypothetical protein